MYRRVVLHKCIFLFRYPVRIMSAEQPTCVSVGKCRVSAGGLAGDLHGETVVLTVFFYIKIGRNIILINTCIYFSCSWGISKAPDFSVQSCVP